MQSLGSMVMDGKCLIGRQDGNPPGTDSCSEGEGEGDSREEGGDDDGHQEVSWCLVE